MRHRAAFLDRDGTILVERGHVTETADLALLPGSTDAIRSLRSAGWKILVVTNQSHVARGQITEDGLQGILRAFEQMMLDAGAPIDGLYYCPHHPLGTTPGYSMVCTCRKPLPGLILRAAGEHDIDLQRSALVGDAVRDLQAGQAAGVGTNVLVRTGHGRSVEHEHHGADHVADDLAAACRWLMRSGGAAGTHGTPLL